MKRLIIEQSDDEFYTSHSGRALVGACINRYSDLGRQVGRLAGSSGQIAEIDILRSYLGLLCLGKSDFQAITGMRDDEYFKQSLGIGRLPSAERLRQRLDEGAAAGLVPLDVDVFPQDNSNTRKEGVSRTDKNFDGYAPIAAYPGMEGWCLELELRPGSQHGQAGFVVFIQRVIKAAHVLIEQEIVVRLDSAHDAEETRQVLAAAEKVRFLIKWNPRKSNVRSWRDRVFNEGTVTTPGPASGSGCWWSTSPCRSMVRLTPASGSCA